MWSDNETVNDLIGFKVHVDLIKSVVTDPSLLPVTIGVFGDWGSGKTSIMKIIENDLNPDNWEDPEEKKKYEDILCIYFNGWLFEGYDDAKAAIIETVLTQIKDHQRFGEKVKEKVSDLIRSVNWLRVAQIGIRDIGAPILTAYLSGMPVFPQLLGAISNENNESETISKIFEDMQEQQKNIHMDVRTFRSKFEDMLKESDISSLVVIIDDLDRCSPERIIDNLEAIKLFLNVDNTAFIIGADPRIIKYAIQERYHSLNLNKVTGMYDEYNEKNLTNDYLEKLIQVPYNLPRLSPTEVEMYMTLLFCSRDISDQELFNAILEACRQKNRNTTFGYHDVINVLGEENTPEQLKESLSLSSQIAPLITDGLKGNPRQIKRFLNAFTLRKKLAQVASIENLRDDVLVKLMVLEYHSLSLFYTLYEWQAINDGFPPQIKKLEEVLISPDDNIDNEKEAKGAVGENWSTSFIRKWINIDPPLSNIDLRDYFWLARDRLSSTLSGMSMISPIVRAILDDLVSGNEGRKNRSLEKTLSLEADEKNSLLDSLKSYVIRNPEKKEGFDALRGLIDYGIESSVQTFKEVLSQCPTEKISAGVAQDIINLVKSNPERKEELNPLIEELNNKAGSDTQLARVLQTKW